MRYWIVATGCAAWLIGGAPAAAEELERQADARSARSEASDASKRAETKKAAEDRTREHAAKSSSLNVYVPPSRGAVGARTGGGSRSIENVPRIAALVPDHVGLTTRAQPTLAWFLFEDTETSGELTVIADGAIEPAVVVPIRGPLRAGIHLVDLAQHAARLEPGTTYEWTVAMRVDPHARDADVIAGGAIEREAATAALASELAAGEPSYRVLARNGIWYDAIADLSGTIASAPADGALRVERAALLEQVGVGAVAAFDRGW